MAAMGALHGHFDFLPHARRLRRDNRRDAFVFVEDLDLRTAKELIFINAQLANVFKGD